MNSLWNTMWKILVKTLRGLWNNRTRGGELWESLIFTRVLRFLYTWISTRFLHVFTLVDWRFYTVST